MGHDENRSNGTVQSVLFVCTGNIFRSVTAEYALKTETWPRTRRASSVRPGSTPSLSRYMTGFRLNCARKGADLTRHIPRQLTTELVEAADLVIAMGRDHQNFIREQFGRDVPLFNQICLGHDHADFGFARSDAGLGSRSRAGPSLRVLGDRCHLGYGASHSFSPPLARFTPPIASAGFILGLDRTFFSTMVAAVSVGWPRNRGYVEASAIFSIGHRKG